MRDNVVVAVACRVEVDMAAGRADVESGFVGVVVTKNLAEDIENKVDKQCTDMLSVDSPYCWLRGGVVRALVLLTKHVTTPHCRSRQPNQLA
jgi:hypothetical protein